VGAEVEMIPVDAETRRPVPITAEEGPSTLPLLRRFGAERCWREEATPYGAPRWILPDGGCVSYEPGGQIELSAAPARSASDLLRSLRAVVPALRAAARDEGIDLLSLGIDPFNALEDTSLQLPGPRYARLTRFLESIGTGGVRMMRQTAAFQASLDWGPDPLARWRMLNAAAPYLTAIFANSPVYRGQDTGWRSFRARVWRELDGGRTGTFPCADPVGEYLRFALDAPALLPGGEDGPWLPFRAWTGATADDWRAHLTTLFPEVRPKGFVEVRCIDAMDPEWYAAPVLLLTGLCDHAPTFRAALGLLGAPDPALLEPAARLGLSDPRIASVARDLIDLGLTGAEALGASPEDLYEAREFFAR
jgi:glutamate--cysteine ligase